MSLRGSHKARIDDRGRLKVPAENKEQSLYVSEPLKHTQRVMLKDENVCVHCGLCAERCPTAAWDMAKSSLCKPYAVDEANGLEQWKQLRKVG